MPDLNNRATDRSCYGCKFWQPFPDEDDHGGECRRYAPRPNPGDDPDFVFPNTAMSDWCGEFKSRFS